MRNLIPLALLLMPLAGGSAVAQNWAKRMFTDSRHDFGTIAKGAKAEFEFPFTNLYVEDVHVASVSSSCGCASVRVKDNKRLLKTRQTGAIVARINSSTFVGSKNATITVKFDRPYWAEVQLHVSAYVRSDVLLRPGSVQLGSVEQGSAVEKKIVISSPGGRSLHIREVRSANPHLSGKIIETGRTGRQTGYELRVRLDANAPAGYVRDHLVLVTSDHRNSQVPVLVEGHVRSAISISPPALFMGVLKPGEKVSKKFVIQANEPFVIKKIRTAGEGFEFDTSAEQAPKQLHVIPVTFVAGDEPGKIVQAIQIETDHQDLQGELLAQIMVVGPDGKVPESTAEPARPGALEPDPTTVAPPAANPPRLARPDLDDDLPDRPILRRFPRLHQLVRERDAAARERELRLRGGTPTLAPRRSGEPASPQFRNEAQRRRYEDLLRRNGASPAANGIEPAPGRNRLRQ